MNRIDELKQEIEELNKIAIDWQNKLHDLAEGLPMDLDKLMETAQSAYDAFSVVKGKRMELKELKKMVK